MLVGIWTGTQMIRNEKTQGNYFSFRTMPKSRMNLPHNSLEHNPQASMLFRTMAGNLIPHRSAAWLARRGRLLGLRIHIAHVVNAARSQDVVDANDVLVAEAQQDLDLSQRALAVRLVLKWADLLNGHSELVHVVKSRAKGSRDGGQKERVHSIKRARKVAQMHPIVFMFFKATTNIH